MRPVLTHHDAPDRALMPTSARLSIILLLLLLPRAMVAPQCPLPRQEGGLQHSEYKSDA